MQLESPSTWRPCLRLQCSSTITTINVSAGPQSPLSISPMPQSPLSKPQMSHSKPTISRYCYRSLGWCPSLSPQASARALVSFNAIQSDRIHLEEASIWADDSNFTFKTRQPDGGTLPAPAGGPPELAQRRPHPVPGLGEQCKDELMKVKVQR